MATVLFGRLVRRPDRPERLALVDAEGRLNNWFARDHTRKDIKESLRKHGLELLDDDTVVRQE